MKIVKFYNENENEIKYSVTFKKDNNNTIIYYLNNVKIDNVIFFRNYLKENYNLNLYELINL